VSNLQHRSESQSNDEREKRERMEAIKQGIALISNLPGGELTKAGVDVSYKFLIDYPAQLIRLGFERGMRGEWSFRPAPAQIIEQIALAMGYHPEEDPDRPFEFIPRRLREWAYAKATPRIREDRENEERLRNPTPAELEAHDAGLRQVKEKIARFRALAEAAEQEKRELEEARRPAIEAVKPSPTPACHVCGRTETFRPEEGKPWQWWCGDCGAKFVDTRLMNGSGE
jgi:hypothetical protein